MTLGARMQDTLGEKGAGGRDGERFFSNWLIGLCYCAILSHESSPIKWDYFYNMERHRYEMV